MHGQLGSDTYQIGLAGNGTALINVFDQSGGDTDPGIDDLFVFGTNDADFFLLRANREARAPKGLGVVAAYRLARREPLWPSPPRYRPPDDEDLRGP